MFSGLLTKIFGSRNERTLKRMRQSLTAINALEDTMAALSDADFPQKTAELRERYQQGESLGELLPVAFALVREAAKRSLGMRHFDVQHIGGMVLHESNIAEIKTGEGKTLVATLPVYLNALSGKGVHVITVNDYLAQRDTEWMGQIYTFLGMTTGVIISGMSTMDRRAAYQADITYGTNNEFGFDYLRDNMALSSDERVQRGLNFAIVDEVDSILIDEARTPLIISGVVDDRSDLYVEINKIVPQLRPESEENAEGDYTIDEKSKQIYLTESGHDHAEQLLQDAKISQAASSLYDPANIEILHHLNAALRAHALFHRDVDYLVKDNTVVIVDEFTGRTMEGRRWSDGLHQAIEAKEQVPIQNESQTLASITYQNYFRLYEKLAGMTGTADTEAFEFQQIYALDVVVVPTHRNMIRRDEADVVFLTAAEKYAAIIIDIKQCVETGQPVLVGTASIEVSEYLSKCLDKEHIKHQVLNAKLHAKEADIIAQSGLPGVVTIATNMAGRGTDIVLGGNIEIERHKSKNPSEEQLRALQDVWQRRHATVIDSGGLHIIGTERHESRRIDNQLRGRSGRQGDPGSSRFYISLEDNLMRIFASEKVSGLMQKLGMEKGEAIESKLVSRMIENAQRKVEAHNFDIRKHVLEYDDVANDQRKVVYEQRNELLEEDSVAETIEIMRDEFIGELVDEYVPIGSLAEIWELDNLQERLFSEFGQRLDFTPWHSKQGLNQETLRDEIIQDMAARMQEREQAVTPELMRRLEQQMMLHVLDKHWKDHLLSMDYLRQGIGLRGYAAKNPKQEFKREAFAMFIEMLDNIKHDVIRLLFKLRVSDEQDLETVAHRQQDNTQNIRYDHPAAPNALQSGVAQSTNSPFVRPQKKIGRNESCHCGSGKKYKHCHGHLS